MDNIKLLENKWRSYIVKRYIKSIFIFFIIIIAGLSLFFINSSEKLDLSFDFFEDKDVVKTEKPMKKIEVVDSIKPTEKIEKPKEKNTTKEIVTPLPKREKIEDSNIERVSSKSDNSIKIVKTDKNIIEILNEKFLNNPSTSIALQLTREYFKAKKYETSLNWAIKTNELDDSIEEAWIYYAKNMVKLGKVNDAKIALKIYLSKYESNSVSTLLDSLKHPIDEPLMDSEPKKVEKVQKKEKIVEKEQPKVEKVEIEKRKVEIPKSELRRIKDIKRSFYTAPNTKDAIALYKTYMRLKNYEYALFWSKKLIKLDRNYEQGYIYFANASIRLNRKKEAIRELEKYLNKHKSKRIERILNEIKG